MTLKDSRDRLRTLRQTITAIDNDPGSLTPQLEALRQLLESRLIRLEAEQQTCDPSPSPGHRLQ